jgi:hypothetical protein
MCNYIYTTDGKYIKQKIYEQFDGEQKCTNTLISQYRTDNMNELIPYDSNGNPQLDINKCPVGCISRLNNKPLPTHYVATTKNGYLYDTNYHATTKNGYLYNNCPNTCKKYCSSSTPISKKCNICDKLNEMNCNYKIVNETCPDLCKDWMENDDNAKNDEINLEEDIFAEAMCKKIKELNVKCKNPIYNECYEKQ